MPRDSSTSSLAGWSSSSPSCVSSAYTVCSGRLPTPRLGQRLEPGGCLPGAGWEPVEASFLTIALGPSHPPITVNRYLIQKDRDQQVVLYWYYSQGQAIAGEVPARVAMVKSALLHNRTDGAIVRLMSPTYGSAREASERLVA